MEFKIKSAGKVWIIIAVACTLLSIFQIKINSRGISLPETSLNITGRIQVKDEIESKNNITTMLRPVVKLSLLLTSQTKNSEQEFEAIIMANATGVSVAYDEDKDVSFILSNDHFCKEEAIIQDSMLVVETSESPIIESLSNNFKAGTIIRQNKELDLCLIMVDGFIMPARLSIPGKKYSQFSEVYIVGGPAGVFPIITKSYLSGYVDRNSVSLFDSKRNGNDLMFISELVFPGHSGSPVYSNDNEMIGIIFASLQVYGSLAIPIEDVYTFLEI